MTQYVGLDVSLKETKLHVLDEAGNRVWRGRCAIEPAAIAAAVRRYAPTAVRIGLETGPLTTWLWTALTGEGLPMVCLDARHAKKALDMKVNKTDPNDAEGMCRDRHRKNNRADRLPCLICGASLVRLCRLWIDLQSGRNGSRPLQ
jgi:transposase